MKDGVSRQKKHGGLVCPPPRVLMSTPGKYSVNESIFVGATLQFHPAQKKEEEVAER